MPSLLPPALVVVVLLLRACFPLPEEDGASLVRVGPLLAFGGEAGVALVDLEAFRIELHDAGGLLGAQAAGGRGWERADGSVVPLGAVRSWEREGRRLSLAVESADGEAEVVLVWRGPRTLEVEIVPPAPGDVIAFHDAWRLRPGERIYGLTERAIDSPPLFEGAPPVNEFQPVEAGTLDRRGETVEMYVRPTIAVYAPLHHSSAGYGMLVDGTLPGAYDVGASDPDVLSLRFEAPSRPAERSFRSFLFVGDPRAVVDAYTALTGRPRIPPDWAFLHWRWRDELFPGPPVEVDGVPLNPDLADDLLRYEELGIPPGVYLIDRPWAPGSFGFDRLAWDRDRFPAPEGMLAVLAARGYEVGVWTSAWAMGDDPGDPGTEARARGWLAPGSDRVLDLTDPDAFAWWRGLHADFLRTFGIRALKLDRGEERTPSRAEDVWADGRTGREVHNAFPVLQLRLMDEALRDAHGGDGVVMTRSAYTGAQRHGIVWGGDSPGSVGAGAGPGTDLGLRNAILAQLRVGFLGFPFWGSDTGGYYEFEDREVFARWLQFSAFCPLMEIGGQGTHAPWDMPTDPAFDPELIAIYRRSVRVHHDLAPYVRAHARIARETGLPIARALVFDHPDDPEVGDLWDQYLYGDALLVAPVWRTGQRARDVYLPEGRWQGFWDRSQTWQGPTWIRAEAPLDTIPVFVRAGSPLPVPD